MYAASDTATRTQRPVGQLESQVNNLETEVNRANNLCARLESIVRRLRGAGAPTPQGLLKDPNPQIEPARPLVDRAARASEAIADCHTQIDNLLSELDGLI